MSVLGATLPVLQAGVLNTPLGQLLAALVALALVLLVGRLFLRMAWRVVTIGIVLVAAALAVSMLGIGF
ncbi:hypothetical protein ACFO0N_04375 [Halobium salinum]|uniref:Major facilitator superfamily (MFS) profile domain-containing protein n=1 Tax=Halobium salinum TaxID=1364940 RepID=A0ABD5P8Z6_9EURY|nr:hypothetical protein [Halobium salinum]